MAGRQNARDVIDQVNLVLDGLDAMPVAEGFG
jgi:hypothetical protein